MDTVIDVLNGYFTAGLTGFAYAVGVAIACKALKWAPVNITVNLEAGWKAKV